MKLSPSSFYSVNELCELLRVKPETAYAWKNRKKFTTYKVGGVLLFDADEVNRSIENGKHRSVDNLIMDSKLRA